MKETEVKLKSSRKEHTRIMKELQKLGFKKIKSVYETNVLYEHPLIPIKSDGNVLRIRKADVVTMTFKGKQRKNKNNLKVREEYEVIVSDGKNIEKILSVLGFRADIVIRKRRTVYRKSSIEVDLDTLPTLGYFIEIEGTEKAVLSTLKKLNLETRERITKGYAQLIMEAKR